MKKQGQSAIYIILIVVAAAAIILSFIIRTLLNFRSSAVSERSARVFSASEAGIEEALRRGLAVADFSVNVGGITVDVTSQALRDNNFFIFPRSIKKDETVTIWLVQHSGSPPTPQLDTAFYSANNIDVCWGTPGDPVDAAIIFTLIYKEAGQYKVAKWAFDTPAGSSSRGNNFESTNINTPTFPSPCENETRFIRNVDLSSIAAGSIFELIRIKPLYSDAKIGVVGLGGAQIPAQGVERISTAILGDVTRRSKVFQSYPSLPAIFDYAIFTTGNLTK